MIAAAGAIMDIEVDASHGEEDPSKLDGGGRERKRRRTDDRPQPSRWKFPAEQHSYSSKLLEALQHVRRTSATPPAPSAPTRSRALREAADRVLAIAAKGRTRWSRAILSKCRVLRLRRKRRVVASSCARHRKPGPSSPSKGPALERKVRTLGRLVPGCRKLSFPSLLEEVSDYIPALEMQVRAMSALTEILSSLGGSGSPEDRLGSTSSAAATSTGATSSSSRLDT